MNAIRKCLCVCTENHPADSEKIENKYIIMNQEPNKLYFMKKKNYESRIIFYKSRLYLMNQEPENLYIMNQEPKKLYFMNQEQK